MNTHEILQLIDEQSDSACSISHPYNIFYRLLANGYIVESGKRIAEDSRRRQYYAITEEGRAYYRQIRMEYENFIAGASKVLAFSDLEDPQ